MPGSRLNDPTPGELQGDPGGGGGDQIPDIPEMQKMVSHSRSNPRQQRYRLGLEMGPSAHCRVLLSELSQYQYCNSLTESS